MTSLGIAGSGTVIAKQASEKRPVKKNHTALADGDLYFVTGDSAECCMILQSLDASETAFAIVFSLFIILLSVVVIVVGQ